MLKTVRHLISEDQGIREKSTACNQIAKRLMRVTLFALLSQAGSALGQSAMALEADVSVVAYNVDYVMEEIGLNFNLAVYLVNFLEQVASNHG